MFIVEHHCDGDLVFASKAQETTTGYIGISIPTFLTFLEAIGQYIKDILGV